MNPLMGNRKKNNLPHWYRSTVSQVGVMREGTQVRKTPRSITIWTRDVIRLSNPSRTVFGSSPTLTTKSHESELTARNRRQYSQVACWYTQSSNGKRMGSIPNLTTKLFLVDWGIFRIFV
jgi:exopolysaccharide biosynthesis protein